MAMSLIAVQPRSHTQTLANLPADPHAHQSASKRKTPDRWQQINTKQITCARSSGWNVSPIPSWKVYVHAVAGTFLCVCVWGGACVRVRDSVTTGMTTFLPSQGIRSSQGRDQPYSLKVQLARKKNPDRVSPPDQNMAAWIHNCVTPGWLKNNNGNRKEHRKCSIATPVCFKHLHKPLAVCPLLH